jgi:hypothetical protein
MRKAVGFALLGMLLLGIGLGLVAQLLGRGALGQWRGAGEIRPLARDPENISARQEAQLRAGGAAPFGEAGAEAKQILFGDLHVHTTFSTDAFMLSLPMYQGEGAHPPADACDFARFCSGLDFWSINDHAEGLSPDHWQETRDTIRQCNAVAASSSSPDLISFLGWEWTQIGGRPSDHYGHKNVILRDTADGDVPSRPISSRRELFPPSSGARPIDAWLRALLIAGSPGSADRQPYHDFARFLQDREELPSCPEADDPRSLPADCHESAATPQALFDKLDAWGFPYLVVPHGNTWGIYTPPGSSWDHQLEESREPERTEPLMEIFSGHGNSEEYRPWRSLEISADGRPRCPAPSPGYLPECWRAGEIIRSRCLEAGETETECEDRAQTARQNHADAGIAGHLTVPGATTEDWLDAGQCSDCYMPSYNYRPGGASQYALALTDFGDPQRPKRFRFGFLASSDVHTARPGIGYKELARPYMTDAGLSNMGPPRFGGIPPEPRSKTLGATDMPAADFERSASFFGTGGLVAVHAESRDREAIWQALERREVYGTSGDRMLLHFDWLPAGGGAAQPMGAEIRTADVPRFRVRAVGALQQQPGCPDDSREALGPDELLRLCRGECYHPADTRHTIDRIEVVRVRPQMRPGEPIDPLIEDPWLTIPCAADPAGCRAEFSDPDFARAGRDATYYVRAIQTPTPTINGDHLRCTRDASGACIETQPCAGSAGSDRSDDCLAEVGERAWSSPIFLVHSSPGE